MTKSIFFYLLTFILLLLAYLFSRNPRQQTSFKQITIANKKYNVEVVTSKKDLSIGLSKYNKIPNNQGMLFVFNSTGKHRFWMRNMKFDIDIIWIKNNKIIGITQGYYSEPYKLITPPEPIDSVLELNTNSPLKINQVIKYAK